MGCYLIREPDYFRKFRCAGSECKQSCCEKWENLIWLNEEYEKLCSADLPSGMRENVKSAFIRIEIPEFDVPLWNLKLSGKKCPFLAENSLCSIQRKFGEEFLSNTCRFYPRVSVFNSGILTRGCYASCPEIAKMLLDNEFALEICTRQVQVYENEIVFQSVLCEGEEDFRENPALRFRNELFGLFYDIFADRKRTLEENMLLGAEIAKRISEVEKAEGIPRAIDEQKKWFKKPDFIPENRCNSEKIAELFPKIFGENCAFYSKSCFTAKKTAESEKLFPKHFFRNFALNLLFELKMPFYFPDKSVYENYLYLYAVYSLARLIVSASGAEGGVEFALEKLSAFDREILHDSDAAERILSVFPFGN